MKHSHSDDSLLIVARESAVSAKERREYADTPPLPLPAAILNMFKEQGASNTIILLFLVGETLARFLVRRFGEFGKDHQIKASLSSFDVYPIHV